MHEIFRHMDWRSGSGDDPAMQITTSRRIFAHDEFLGQYEMRLPAGGFVVARRVPTVPEDEVEEHTHTEAHFVLLMQGAYVSSAVGAPAVAARPLLIYNPPGTTHRDCFRGDGGQFFTVSVSMATQRHFADAVALPDHACVLGRAALDVALNMAAGATAPTPHDGLIVESLCAELLTATAFDFKDVLDRAPAWLQRARELMHDDCGAELSLSDVAMAAGVHPVHLTRTFRHHFGCTPGDYLRRCRLTKAAALLTDTAADLADVAEACGYFDQAHFSHTFKAAFGISPRGYRLGATIDRAGLPDTRPIQPRTLRSTG